MKATLIMTGYQYRVFYVLLAQAAERGENYQAVRTMLAQDQGIQMSLKNAKKDFDGHCVTEITETLWNLIQPNFFTTCSIAVLPQEIETAMVQIFSAEIKRQFAEQKKNAKNL